MDDLISRKAAIEAAKHAWAKGLEPSQYIEIIPSVPAVPLDKLCEWLARFGCPCEINDGMCDMSHGVDRCLGIFNSSSFCWKYLLTKWMEDNKNAARSE